MIKRDSKLQVQAGFARRADRAENLAAQYQASREPLLFAARLYRAQGASAAELEREKALLGVLEKDRPHVLDAAQPVLRAVAEAGPAPLAELASSRIREDHGLLHRRLAAYWNGESTTLEDYLARSMLRPYVEVLAHRRLPPDRVHRAGNCPFCGGRPWVGARRSLSSADGAERLMYCSLCGGEWLVRRILCLACGEEDPNKLPSFQVDAYPLVRIEACDVCHRYVKSIDLTLDARPIPEVDDLASIGVDVWALEQGYSRLEPGLAGV